MEGKRETRCGFLTQAKPSQANKIRCIVRIRLLLQANWALLQAVKFRQISFERSEDAQPLASTKYIYTLCVSVRALMKDSRPALPVDGVYSR
jgi:type IV secretory pathway VirB4 component